MLTRSFLTNTLLVLIGTLVNSSFLSAQGTGLPTVEPSLGIHAVDVVLKRYALNPTAIAEKTGKPLHGKGKWSINRKVPAACPTTKETCLQVLYQVPEDSVICSWVVLLDQDGEDGKILDENEEAEHYLIRRVFGSEAVLQIGTRQKPTYPPIAEAAHVRGAVTVSVMVSPTGEVRQLALLSGPEMLRASVYDAARGWTFKPLVIGSRSVAYQVNLVFTFQTQGPYTGSTIVMTP